MITPTKEPPHADSTGTEATWLPGDEYAWMGPVEDPAPPVAAEPEEELKPPVQAAY